MANRQLKARRPSPSRFGDADRTATPAQPTLFRGGKISTIQPFSRKCPIGHALDIPFEPPVPFPGRLAGVKMGSGRLPTPMFPWDQ